MICLVENGDIVGVRANLLRSPDHGVAGVVDRIPDLSANASEDRCTIGSAFLGFDNFYGLRVNSFLNLTPNGGASAASS